MMLLLLLLCLVALNWRTSGDGEEGAAADAEKKMQQVEALKSED